MSIISQGLDPHIPAFQTNDKGFTEKHADNVAYESMDASGNIALQATPAYHYIILNKNRNTTHTNDSSVINHEAEQKSTQDVDYNNTHDHYVQHHTTPFNHFQPITETQNTGQDNDDIVTRSREDENRVFAVISNLFPSAREN